MAGVWKRDGTIAVTKGSKKVVGTGTTFADPKNAAAKGHLLVMVAGTAVDLYEVDYAESNTVFYLVEAYRGDTGTGKAYAIDTSRTDSIPEFARRLNATLGAYQQQSDAVQALLTSDAATIEVTAPDGTKHTMIPWKRVTSEGEGQATRAKAEADKAAVSAAAAAAAVSDAAMPFPDVWIPFNDSLRMFAGHGREVKVGEDVIGRFVNFTRATTATFIDKSGALRTAAINEPRFETEGLLVEGSSTNLTPVSEGWLSSSGATGGNTWSHTSKDALGWITVSGGTDDGRAEGSYKDLAQGTAIQGLTATCSFDVKKVAGYKFRVTTFVGGSGSDGLGTGIASFVDGQALPSSAGLTVKDMGTWLRISITRKFGDGTSIFRLYPFGGDPGSSGALTYRRVQVEIKPYATSYIPTSGAQATRAADSVNIPAARNINPTNTDVTYAMTVEFRGAQIRPFRTDGSISPSGVVIASNGKAWFFSDAATTVTASSNMAVMGMNTFIATNNVAGVAVYLNGIYGGARTPSRGGAETNATNLLIGAGQSLTDPIDGHIRDFRIWHRAATDVQAKAIR